MTELKKILVLGMTMALASCVGNRGCESQFVQVRPSKDGDGHKAYNGVQPGYQQQPRYQQQPDPRVWDFFNSSSRPNVIIAEPVIVPVYRQIGCWDRCDPCFRPHHYNHHHHHCR